MRLKLCQALVIACLTTAASAAPVHLDRKGERWAASALRKMSLEEQIGQMIMPWARIKFMNVNSPEYLQLRDEMKKYHVGGFGVTVFTDGGALLKSEPFEAAELTNALQRDSKYPLIFGADFERGLEMRLHGATGFPAAMAFGAAGDTNLARQFGAITAREARAIGVQWNWFPVADVNSNPANPIINTRSFGEDPEAVGRMISAYIEGARGAGLLTTVKHFPGHGDTDTDSHLTLARVTASMDRLNSLELVPFKAAIAAGVDSVMTGHITVPAVDPDPNKPASVSTKVITGLLKQQLGFRGIVVTDALDMGALTRVFPGDIAQVSAEEAVATIQAGNDMVIIPADLDGAYNGLLSAVKEGKISRERIAESVLKILRMKASVGLDRDRFVTMSEVDQKIGEPQNIAIAQQVADRAVTLVKDTSPLLPLRAATGGTVAIIFSDDLHGTEGARLFVHQLRLLAPDATVFYANGENAAFITSDVMTAVASASNVIAVAEAVPGARRTVGGDTKGSIGLDQSASGLLTGIVKSAGGKTVVAAFGNPYIGVGIPGIQTYICTFSDAPVSAVSLARALFGEITISGHLPVTILGIAERGAGMERSAAP